MLRESAKIYQIRVQKLQEKWKMKSGKDLLTYVYRKVLREHNELRILVPFSGGKDSLAALLLSLDALQDFKAKNNYVLYIVYVNTTNEFPETTDYVEKIFNKIKKNYRDMNIECIKLRPKKTFSDFVRSVFKKAIEMKIKKKWYKRNLTCCIYLKEKPVKEFAIKTKVNLLVSGLRGNESTRRFFYLYDHGPIDYQWGIKRVWPLWDWTFKRVLDYIVMHNPRFYLNKIYRMGFTGTGCLICPVKFIFGRNNDLIALRRHYPNAYRLGIKLIRNALEELNISGKEIPISLRELISYE